MGRLKQSNKDKTVLVLNKLFLPPCPNCKSTDIVHTDTGRKVIISAYDFFNSMASGLPPDTTKNPKSRAFRCNKCGTVWDEEGGMFRIV